MHPADLASLVATGIEHADSRQPITLNSGTGASYQVGIGPHTERQTLSLALIESAPDIGISYELEVPYPNLPGVRCDLCITQPEPWAIEVKMLRMMCDNGKPNDNLFTRTVVGDLSADHGP